MKTHKLSAIAVLNGKPKMDQYSTDTKWGIFCGIAGGMGQWFAQINTPFYLSKLIEASITAFICGLLGAAGKHLYDILKPKIRNLWRK